MNIVVLCGGLSMERDVSIMSGAMIASALRENGHRAVLVDAFFGYQGEYSDPLEIFSSEIDDFTDSISSEIPDLNLIKSKRAQSNDSRIGDNVIEICRAADIVFIAMHGGDGEDGRLQAAFDISGIRYTGCGYLGCAIAMNKQAAKDMFVRNGILTPDGKVVNINDGDKSSPFMPCVVKPKSNGSSVGTSVVYSKEEYEKALSLGFKYEDDVLVEKYISGREVSVGVLLGKALPPIEICPREGFFDYKNKYQSGMTDEICPADFPAAVTDRLMELAEKVFKALYLNVYSRMDFIVENETGDIYCLEANTLPGMTPASLLPKEALASGMSYNELCETIVQESLKRF